MKRNRELEAARAELAVYREAMSALATAFDAAAEGDMEARVPATPGTEAMADVLALRTAANRCLDRTDAFVREATASLAAASQGRYHRRFLLGGTAGTFRSGARAINAARDVMAQAQARSDAAANERSALADRLESTVLSVAEQMAAASTELSATAATLAHSTDSTVRNADAGGATVAQLEGASQHISTVVSTIARIAAQTKLLALNAAIEAARAGEAGRGFSVVATEVKALADHTAVATDEIGQQVQEVLGAAEESSATIQGISEALREMAPQVDAITIAVDGGGHDGTAMHGSLQGLAQMAELLRTEVGDFLLVMRR